MTAGMLHCPPCESRVLGEGKLHRSRGHEDLSVPFSKPTIAITYAHLIFRIDKTGPEDATTAILFLFDIFGFSPQVLQVRTPIQGLPIILP